MMGRIGRTPHYIAFTYVRVPSTQTVSGRAKNAAHELGEKIVRLLALLERTFSGRFFYSGLPGHESLSYYRHQNVLEVAVKRQPASHLASENRCVIEYLHAMPSIYSRTGFYVRAVVSAFALFQG